MKIVVFGVARRRLANVCGVRYRIVWSLCRWRWQYYSDLHCKWLCSSLNDRGAL